MSGNCYPFALLQNLVTAFGRRGDAVNREATTYATPTAYDRVLPRRCQPRSISGTRKVERAVLDEWRRWRM
jgi:hypothetical protein